VAVRDQDGRTTDGLADLGGDSVGGGFRECGDDGSEDGSPEGCWWVAAEPKIRVQGSRECESGERRDAHVRGDLRGTPSTARLGQADLLLLTAAEARSGEGQDKQRQTGEQRGEEPAAVRLVDSGEIKAGGEQESGERGERSRGVEQPDEKSNGGANGETFSTGGSQRR